jgi:hypothetical protein
MASQIKQIHGRLQRSFAASKDETTQLLAQAKVRVTCYRLQATRPWLHDDEAYSQILFCSGL